MTIRFICFKSFCQCPENLLKNIPAGVSIPDKNN